MVMQLEKTTNGAIRFCTLFVMLLFFILIIGSLEQAHATTAVYEEGSCGPNATYRILKDGHDYTVIINGKGAVTKKGIADFANGDDIVKVLINEGISEIGDEVFYYSHVGEISLPSTLKKIGSGAFATNVSLKKLQLPDGLESVGAEAFSGTSITDFVIPGSVTFIGRYAFSYCNGLKNMTIPASVKTTEGATFAHCHSIEKVTVPNDWTEIPPNFVLDCPKIKSFTIPAKVKIIRMGAFFNCTGMESIYVPDSVVEIQNAPEREEDNWASDECADESGWVGAFWGCTSLKKVRLSNSIKSIGNRTFTNCTELEEIQLPSNLVTLGDNLGKWGVFCDCSSLRKVTIPASLKTINEWVFLRCDSLTDLYYEGSESQWRKLDIKPMGNYNYTSGARVHYNCFKGKIFHSEDYHGEADLTIPEGYTSIDEYALTDCQTIRSVSLPTTLKYIGYYAFQNCTKLTAITIPGGVKYINRGAFSGCTGLKELKIASGVTLVGTDSEGKFSGQVKPSGYGSFEGCTSLKTVHIPKTVVSIGEYSFYNCPSLRDVYYEGTREEWSRIPIVNGSNQPVISVAKKHFNSPAITVREPNCPSARYRDVDTTKWYHPYVDYAVSKGVMAGTSATAFQPDANVTRAMLVQVLYAQENKPHAEYRDRFSDVKNGKWYSSAVQWASDNGIVSGYKDGTFKPEWSISRQEMAVMLYAYAKYKDLDIKKKGTISRFTDKNQVSKYAETAVCWAVGNEVLSGTGENSLSPRGNTTRAQLATVMKSLMDK